MSLLRFLTPVRFGKAVYGVVVAFFLAELAIGWFVPQEEALQKDLIRRDPKLGYRMVPDYDGLIVRTDIPLRTNSWGLRDREYGPRRDGTLRVFVIGDSMVFGHGVPIEDTFTRFLEPLLSDRLGRPVEVVNGGIPGYGTIQSVDLLEDSVQTVDPDVVLLAVAVFNDISDNVKFGEQLYRWKRDPSALQRLRTWARHNSQVYRLFRRYRAGVSGHEMMQIHAKTPDADTLKGLQLTKDSVLRAAQFVAERGLPFGIIINPAQKQVSDKSWSETVARFDLDPAEFDWSEPNGELARFTANNGIPAIDLLPVFRSRPEQNFYFSEHWKAPGHQLVAQEIASFLVANNLLSRRAPSAVVRARESDTLAAPPAAAAGVN